MTQTIFNFRRGRRATAARVAVFNGQFMNWTKACLMISLMAATGCVSRSTARLREQNAYLAGQNAMLLQQTQQEQQQQAATGVTIVGPVQNPQVPWVTGMTLAQALATANYVGDQAPQQVIITRHGESASFDASALMQGGAAKIPLEIGDVIELK